jgi:NADH-quinone oxidoreductase subunit M
LLKIGTYGFLRFSLPMLPAATAMAMPWILGLAAAGIIYGALVALAQRDVKRLVAYSSVSHLGFCMLGIFALSSTAVQGGALQMINHGLATGGLFALVGMLYERYHTRQIDDLAGLARRLPVLAFFLVILSLSSIGLPGLGGFVGEFLILMGTFRMAWTLPPDGLGLFLRGVSVLAVAGVVLGAWYMLWLVERMLFGPLKEPGAGAAARDLSFREIAALAPLAAMLLWIGLQPSFFLDRMAPTLDQLRTPAAMESKK